MESPTKRHLFRLYWRSFLPIWLLPILVTAVGFVANFTSEDTAVRILPYLVAGLMIYVVATQIRPLGLWRRREITYWELQLLYAPAGLVAIVCFVGWMFAFNPVHR
jgi:hypothetical protein